MNVHERRQRGKRVSGKRSNRKLWEITRLGKTFGVFTLASMIANFTGTICDGREYVYVRCRKQTKAKECEFFFPCHKFEVRPGKLSRAPVQRFLCCCWRRFPLKKNEKNQFRSNLGRLLTAGSGWRDLPLDEVRAPGKEFATSLGRALAGESSSSDDSVCL